jgi:adenylyltransferase/sulfurtransferase
MQYCTAQYTYAPRAREAGGRNNRNLKSEHDDTTLSFDCEDLPKLENFSFILRKCVNCSVEKAHQKMVEESQELLFASDHSTVSDHVVLSSSAIADARTHQQVLDNNNNTAGGGGQMMRMVGQRPSTIMREWFDDMKRRASQLMTPPPNDHEDEYYLVPVSGSVDSEHVRLDDSHEVEGLEVSMMVDIHSDPMVEIMLENRISNLETDLEACEIEYEKRIRALEFELQQKSLEQGKDNIVYQSRIQELELHVNSLQKENKSLQVSNQEKTAAAEARQALVVEETQVEVEQEEPQDEPGAQVVDKLSMDQIERYSRQLLLQDGFGIEGQCKLLSSSVLVVGAGGIGSSVLMYLAASGVGHISVVDFDEVDMSNLHRQVIHTESNVGLNKAVSACRAMKALNPSIRCTPIQDAMTFDNALDIVARHDCIVDASDNPRTRYLINDACVLAKKPLVSGSAMGTEGQLTVYNHNNGPCYRCLYPKPNATEGCKSCSDNGVLGPAPGLIGVLQSTEVLKLLTGVGATMHDRLLMYDALRCSFVNIKKPPKSKKCPVCSEDPSIQSMEDSKAVSLIARGPTGIVEGGKRVSLYIPPPIAKDLSISCTDYNKVRKQGVPHILLDVRVKQQFDMCSIDGAINIPLAELGNQLDRLEDLSDGTQPIYCLCRRGIFSVEATQTIAQVLVERPRIRSIKNISGGLASWTKEVDPSFPKY